MDRFEETNLAGDNFLDDDGDVDNDDNVMNENMKRLEKLYKKLRCIVKN